MLVFRLRVLHSRAIEVIGCIGVADTIDGVVNLGDSDLEPVVVVAVRALGMVI